MTTTSATTSSSTTGSSLNVSALVSGLMTIANAPLNTLNAKQTSYQSKISAYGLMQSNVATFQTAAQALTNSTTSGLLAYKTTISDPTVLTATANTTAIAGSYTINASTLAQAQNLVAIGQASSTTAISNGVATTVNFNFGTITGTPTGGTYPAGTTFTSNGTATKSIVIDSTNNTLQGIAGAINAANMGFTASIINDGSATPFRLTLTSNTTGASNSVSISTVGGDGTINTLLANDPTAVQHLNQTVAAQNANFTVNGIAVTSTSNTVTTAIPGVTLNLAKAATPATLTVARDTTAATTAVSNFVSAYNTLYSSLQAVSDYKSTSPLAGDQTIRSLQTQLRSIAAGAVTGGTMTNIGQVGISFSSAGVMQLDSTKLATAMSTNYNDVVNLFTSATGYGTLFNNLATTTNASSALGGTFAVQTDSLNQSVKNTTDQIAVMQTRLTALQKQYTTQYSSLDMLLTSMNSTSNYLTQQLSHL